MSRVLCRFAAITSLLLLTPRSAPAPDVPGSAGIVIVVEGIGGWNLLAPIARASLRHAGIPHEVREFRWTHGFGRFIKDLQDTRNITEKAAELAALVRQLRDENPDRPIYLVGHSAGAGIVVRAVELAPPGAVRRLVLLSSALSPTYDLRPALASTQYGVVSFHSPHDRAILGMGTRQFGTVDRFYVRSAGLNGFEVPQDMSDSDRVLYGRLVQIPWRSRMLLEANFGGHTGTCVPGFLMAEVAPWLRY